MNPTRKGYTAPGTKHERIKVKSPCGHAVRVDRERPPFWPDLVVPGPRPTGVRRPFVVDVPARAHVLTESKDVQGPVPGQPSRRERRVALVKAASAARKAARRGDDTAECAA